MTQPIPIPIVLLNQARQKPQPYQERFFAALQSGERLETFSERWDRERTADKLVKAFVPIGQAARRAQAAMAPFARQIIEAERGDPLGRKRRARRARGR